MAKKCGEVLTIGSMDFECSRAKRHKGLHQGIAPSLYQLRLDENKTAAPPQREEALKISDKQRLDWLLSFLSSSRGEWNTRWGREDIDLAIESGVKAHGSFSAAIRAEKRGRGE